MKRLLTLLLVFILILSGCGSAAKNSSTHTETTSVSAESPQEEKTEIIPPEDPREITSLVSDSEGEIESEIEPTEYHIPERENNFRGLNDPNLLLYVEDSVYTQLVGEFASEDYFIENVRATYISKEYIEEVSYNSQSNIFFGYTLAELDAQFQGTRYVFSLDENGQTIVKPFEKYDDTYEKVIKNVAIGTGVILVCVTVSVITGGAGLAPVSMVFAASAKTAAEFALSGAVIGGVSAGIVEGIKTKNFDAALKAAALGGSEGYKWGAISGAITGGVSKLSDIRRATKAVDGLIEHAPNTVQIPKDAASWQQAEYRALNQYGGYEQVSFLNGKRVDFGTQGATRPDIIRNLGDHIEAIEVKCYNLESQASRAVLKNELLREVKSRVVNLPKGSTQRIVLDVTGRGFSEATCNAVKNEILESLKHVYKNIPIDIIGL